MIQIDPERACGVVSAGLAFAAFSPQIIVKAKNTDNASRWPQSQYKRDR